MNRECYRVWTWSGLSCRTLAPAFLVFAAGLSGCGNTDRPSAGKLYEVKGSVLLPDGKPLTGGTVDFEPVKGSVYLASGAISPDGTFSLKTANQGDGAAVGEYRIRIVPDEATVGFVTKGKTKTRDLSKLPYSPKYLDADTSELTVTVKPESNQLESFKLSKASKAPPTKESRD
jgi:hypothetical protein